MNHSLSRLVGIKIAFARLALASLVLTVTPASAAPGGLDTSFGTPPISPYSPAGVVRGFPVSAGGANTISTALAAIRSDGGYYLVVPCTSGGNATMCVTAYSANGALENPFDPIAPIVQPGGTTLPGGIAVDANDHAWIAGTCNGQGCVIKRLRSGGVANNLGASGNLSRIDIPTMVFAAAIDVGPDGKIAVGGRCFNGDQYHPCAVRLLPNGVIDPAFNSGNLAIWGEDPFAAIEQVVDGIVRKVIIAGDGRIYAGGRCQGAAIEWMCVAILEVDGSRRLRSVPNSQDGFDVYSYYVLNASPIAVSTTFVDMAVQSDGAAVVYGTCRQNSAPLQFACVARMVPDVGLDRMFGTGGLLKPYLRPEPMTAAGMVLRQDGSLVLLANCDVTVSSQTRRLLCVQTHRPSGAFSFQLANNVAANDIEFDPGSTPSRLVWDGVSAVRYRGQALLATASCPDAGGFRWACVAKVSLAPLSAPHGCSPDIDGDGRMLAATDAGLIARIARGATAAAVTTGVVGSGASRSDWNTMRAHLNAQCGMALP